MDTKDWDEMRQVSPTTCDRHERAGAASCAADEFMTFLQEALGGAVTVHQGHMPEIDIISETTATGIWALNDIVICPTACASTATATITKPTKRAPTGGGSVSKLTRLHTDFVMPEES